MADKVNIFICSHKPFKPFYEAEAKPDTYKIITNCNEKFPDTKLSIYRCDNLKCDYDASENVMLNEYRMINCIYHMEDKADYIGICHYRRYYDFNIMRRIDFDVLFKDAEVPIILGSPVYFNQVIDLKHDNETYFGYWHSWTAWKECEVIFKDFYPQYSYAFDEMVKKDFLFNSAMMIMPKELFNDWCEFIFPIYNELKDKLSIRNYEDSLNYVRKYKNEFVKPHNAMYNEEYQARFLGYVIERYANVWLLIDRGGYTLMDKALKVNWFMPKNEDIGLKDD